MGGRRTAVVVEATNWAATPTPAAAMVSNGSRVLAGFIYSIIFGGSPSASSLGCASALNTATSCSGVASRCKLAGGWR